MTSPERESGMSFWPAVGAIGALAVCCAGPVLIAALTATGLGAVIARSAVPAALGLGAIGTIVIAVRVWRRRRACWYGTLHAASGDAAGSPTGDDGTIPKRDPVSFR